MQENKTKTSCCGMGRCLMGGGGDNSYDLLPSLNDLNSTENKDTSTEKEEELFFYNDNGSGQSVVVERNLRASDLCRLLAIKNRVPKDGSWTIIEHWSETGLERCLEDHEEVLTVYRDTERCAKKKKFIFRRQPGRYEFFTNPEDCFPADMVDLSNCDGGVDSDCETPPLQNRESVSHSESSLLATSEDCPPIFSQVWIQDPNKQYWVKTFLLLKDKKLFMSTKVKVVAQFMRHWKGRDNYYKTLENETEQNKASGDGSSSLQFVAEVGRYEVYNCLNARNQLKAPTEFGVVLRPQGEEDFSQALCLSCNTQRDRTCWVTAMRLAKYGKQLRENYRAFKNKQVDSFSPKDYNSYTVPNESVRSRVAMDFTGSVGRIVEDPSEAKAIAISEGLASKRRWRPNPPPPSLRREGGGSEVHLNQPWFHKTLSRQQAATLIAAHSNQDGVFLVRESRSNPDCFVLTFKFGGKIIHMPIHPIVDPIRESLCYTLDHGWTKFYDLLQLVEFYQLNAGTLPTRLTHYIVHASQEPSLQ